MPSVSRLLLSALEGIPQEISLGDLGYFALTGKLELRVRDEVALSLGIALPKSIVAREWTQPIPVKHDRKHPCDLAILSGVNGAPRCLVELKAMYTFDVLIHGATPMRLPEKLLEDCEARLKDYEVRTLGILIATHPLVQIGKSLGWGVVKYDSDINRAFKRHNFSQEQIASASKERVEDLFKKEGYQYSGRHKMQAGSWLGTDVEIHYWVIERTTAYGPSQS
jgi:hypothetical protein